MHMEIKAQTTVAESIDAVSEKEQYDAACKRVLSEKIILAWIMKGCLDEYRDCGVNEIAEQYIEGEPEVSRVAVMPDETNVGGRVRGMNTEDTSLNEGRVTFDIRFYALLPDTAERVRLIINVEAQNDDHPGYPLTRRAVFYCGRLLSAQYGVEFTNSDYKNVKKVISIWVCINPAQKRQNTITRYALREENLVGAVREKREDYDLLNVVMIGLGAEQSETDSELLRLLNVLLGSESAAPQKKAYLQEEFAIPMTTKFEREVSEMCNLSEGVERRGIAKGIAKGRAEGVAEGRAKGRAEGQIITFAELVRDNILTLADAAKRQGLSVAEFVLKAGELGYPVQ